MIDFLLPVRIRRHVTVTHEVPRHYREFRLPSARPVYVKGPFGDYLRQNMRCRDADLQLTVFKIEKAVDLFLRVRRPLPVLPFMLQGNILCRLRGFGKVLLTEGFSHLFYVPSGEKHSARLAPGTHCSFHIDDSRQFLQKLAAGHPECREVLESVAGRSPKGIRQHHARITLPVRALIDDILQCPEEEPDRTLFLETKIRELLLLYVNDLPQEAVLLKPQVRQLEEIRDHLLTHLDEPHTIPSLAKRFHLSETTLRRRFQQHFQEPVHHFLVRQRMENAMELLTRSDLSIGQIGMKVGYPEFSSFTRAFSRYFHHPPGYYRKPHPDS